MKWEIKLNNCEHSGSYTEKKNYKKALKKATYYVREIEEKLNFKVTEDLRLAYKRIKCDINKALEDSAIKTPCWMLRLVLTR